MTGLIDPLLASNQNYSALILICRVYMFARMSRISV